MANTSDGPRVVRDRLEQLRQRQVGQETARNMAIAKQEKEKAERTEKVTAIRSAGQEFARWAVENSVPTDSKLLKYSGGMISKLRKMRSASHNNISGDVGWRIAEQSVATMADSTMREPGGRQLYVLHVRDSGLVDVSPHRDRFYGNSYGSEENIARFEPNDIYVRIAELCFKHSIEPPENL